MFRETLTAAVLLLAGGPALADSKAPFLWEVKGAQGSHYLMGSVHLLPEAADALPDGISEAYEAAEGLVFESDVGALNSPKFGVALLAQAKSARGLKADLDTQTYAKVQTRMSRLGMPAQLCNEYKPWFCALTLEIFAFQKAGFTGDHGLDHQLYDLARADGKAIDWFESPGTQLDLFAGMDEATAKQLLSSELTEDGDRGDEPKALFEAWRDNDTAKIEALLRDMKLHFPQIYNRLLANRNRAWSAKLRKLLDGDQSELIVVGAAHWIGPDGLLEQLKTEGYRVKPFAADAPKVITGTVPAPRSSASARRPAAVIVGTVASR